MKILYLQQLLVLPGSSGNDRSFEFAREWVRRGHEVTVLCSTACFPTSVVSELVGKEPYYLELEGVKIYALNVGYRHMMPFWRRVLAFLRFYLKALKVGKRLRGHDVLLAYSAPLSVGELGRKLAQYHQIPWVFELGDVWPEVPIGMGIIRSAPLIRWLRKRTHKMYESASSVLCFSEGMREQVLAHGGQAEKVSVIHNGVDVDRVPFVRRTHVPAKAIHVVYAGTLGRANGLEQVLQAARYIQDRGRTDLWFSILGEGTERQRLMQLAHQKRLRHLAFVPQIARHEVAAFLAKADIGLVCFAPYPVLEANGATKFFDYLASGLPMVINYEGWQAEYLRAYECGLACPQGDVEAFGRQILHLADRADLREQFGANGRKLAEAHFHRPELAGKTLQALWSASAKEYEIF